MQTDDIKYDLIGDIHGEYPSLISLLSGLGYAKHQGVWQHPERKVIFLGDFVDRGRYQAEVLGLVRPMVEQGHALAVMGNHEFNAIAYFTPDGNGGHLRPRSDKNLGQHRAFLNVFEQQPELWQSHIDWFRSLPLWLELDGLRVIHACWDKAWIGRLEAEYNGNQLTDELLHAACDETLWEFEAVETLLKGKEIPLPQGHPGFADKDGNRRHHIRVRWWDNAAATYQKAFLGPDDALSHIPDEPIAGDHLLEYGHHEKPVFLGHYWLVGMPALLGSNIACLDYSVAKPGGKLVAYRWRGEQALNDANFFWSELCARSKSAWQSAFQNSK